MPCCRFGNTIICVPRMYRYGGFTFEDHSYLGPMRLRKDLEPSLRQGPQFWRVVGRWRKLPKREREKLRLE